MPFTLPPELLLIIIESSSGFPDNLDTDTLSRLCLVSRTALAVARPILYRKVPVHLESVVLKTRHRYHHIVTQNHVGNALRRYTHLAGYVEHLELGFESHLSSNQGLCEATRTLLGDCYRLNRLQINYNDNAKVIEEVLGSLAREENRLASSVTEIQTAYTGPESQIFLRRFPQLRSLKIPFFALGVEGSLGKPFPFHLERLNPPLDASPSLLLTLLANSTSTLIQLHVSSFQLIALSDHLRHFTSLRDVWITVGSEYCAMEEVGLVLHTLPALQYLNLAIHCTVALCFRHLPPRLQRLDLEGPDCEGVMRLLRTKTRHCLCRIGVPESEWESGEVKRAKEVGREVGVEVVEVVDWRA
ncbi:hypothetical protein BCR35DRAFT_213938 [Leucosporidium creatinivorum]|uniref:F-box domain-containing protein n=1 Tax=Leucosporidium creatinivorum TaxID=106004 RepID=A0A1Y2DAY2_9BASI|nr:hypothetical protein BCR35DRAFT_213938 [Leucosporidium creatinivorum]